MMKKRIAIPIFLLVLISLALVACQPQEVITTVVVTEQVETVVTQEVETIVTQEVEVVVTEVVEVPAEAGEKTVVEFWSTDNEEERVDTYEDIAARFMEANPNVEIRIIPIERFNRDFGTEIFEFSFVICADLYQRRAVFFEHSFTVVN